MLCFECTVTIGAFQVFKTGTIPPNMHTHVHMCSLALFTTHPQSTHSLAAGGHRHRQGGPGGGPVHEDRQGGRHQRRVRAQLHRAQDVLPLLRAPAVIFIVEYGVVCLHR